MYKMFMDNIVPTAVITSSSELSVSSLYQNHPSMDPDAPLSVSVDVYICTCPLHVSKLRLFYGLSNSVDSVGGYKYLNCSSLNLYVAP